MLDYHIHSVRPALACPDLLVGPTDCNKIQYDWANTIPVVDLEYGVI